METAVDAFCYQLGLTSMTGFAADHQCPLICGLLNEFLYLDGLAGRR